MIKKEIRHDYYFRDIKKLLLYIYNDTQNVHNEGSYTYFRVLI